MQTGFSKYSLYRLCGFVFVVDICNFITEHLFLWISFPQNALCSYCNVNTNIPLKAFHERLHSSALLFTHFNSLKRIMTGKKLTKSFCSQSNECAVWLNCLKIVAMMSGMLCVHNFRGVKWMCKQNFVICLKHKKSHILSWILHFVVEFRETGYYCYIVQNASLHKIKKAFAYKRNRVFVSVDSSDLENAATSNVKGKIPFSKTV